MSKGLSGLQTALGQNGELRLFGKEICKRRLWKGASLSTGTPSREHGGELLQQGLRKVSFYFYRRPCSLGLREIWEWVSLSMGAPSGKQEGGGGHLSWGL
jgi:hypothetical protein